MTKEDYTTYAERDPGGRITIQSATEVRVTVAKYSNSYLSKDYGLDFFHDFEHRFGFYWDTENQYVYGPVYCIQKALGNPSQNLTAADRHILAYLYKGDANVRTLTLRVWTGAATDGETWTGPLGDWRYYCILTKLGADVTLKIYSDASYTTLVSTLSASFLDDPSFQYIYGACTWYNPTGADRTMQIRIYDLDLTQRSNANLLAHFLVPRGSADLHCTFTVAQGSEDLLSKLELRHSASAALLTKFTVIHFVDLKCKTVVRHSTWQRLQNYTSYTEVDPNDRITIVDPNNVTLHTYKYSNSYLWKGGLSIARDFKHYIDVLMDTTDYYVTGIFFYLTNVLGNPALVATPENRIISLSLTFGTIGGRRITLSIWKGSGGDSDYIHSLTGDTWYYITLTKSGSTVTAEIFSDASRTTLLDTLQVSFDDDPLFQLIYGAATSYTPTGAERHFLLNAANLTLTLSGENLKCKCIIRHSAARDLHAVFETAAWTDLKAYFEVTHWARLKCSFWVRKVYDLSHSDGISFYWYGSDVVDGDQMIDFEMWSPTGGWVAKFPDGEASWRWVFLAFRGGPLVTGVLREVDIAGSRPDKSQIEKILWTYYSKGVRRIDAIRAWRMCDLKASLTVRHASGTASKNLSAKLEVRNASSQDLPVHFRMATGQAFNDLKAKFYIDMILPGIWDFQQVWFTDSGELEAAIVGGQIEENPTSKAITVRQIFELDDREVITFAGSHRAYTKGTFEFDAECSAYGGIDPTLYVTLAGLTENKYDWFTGSDLNAILLWWSGAVNEWVFYTENDDGAESTDLNGFGIDFTERHTYKIIWEDASEYPANGRIRLYIDDVLRATHETYVPTRELLFLLGLDTWMESASVFEATTILHSLSITGVS